MKKQAIFFLIFFLPAVAFGAWTWDYGNTLNEIISPAWADEVKNSIKQLATDIYSDPTRTASGVASLTTPLQELVPIAVGVATGAGTTGDEITLPAAYVPAAITDYDVQPYWISDPEGNGNLWTTKGIATFTVFHYGTNTGKTIGYVILRRE